MMRTVEISSLQRVIAHQIVHSNARNQEKNRDAVHLSPHSFRRHMCNMLTTLP